MKTIKPQTEKKIEKILLKLNESWNIKSPFMKLEQGLIELHKRIGQLNRKIKNSTEWQTHADYNIEIRMTMGNSIIKPTN